MRKLFALLGIAVLVLAIAVGARTLLMPSRQLVVVAVMPVAVDAAAVAARLGAAVRFKTIASQDDVDANGAEFDGLHALLQSSFPNASAVLKREAIGKYGLLYTWPGTDPKAPAIGLMAHQDVVPIAPGTEGDWQQPPFSGALKDGYVWGRGAWDDKGNLMSIMEAVDMLAASGFKPRQTVYLIFGQDENFGNAMSGQHHFGWTAKQAVEKARDQVAKLLGAQAREIIFTGGATESIHLAILGLFESAESEHQKKFHLVTSKVEHKCSLEVAHHLEKLGHQVTYLDVNEYGQVSVEQIKNAFRENTLLVSLIHANNEIGSINPIRQIGELCKAHEILFHVDSAQICGKHPIDVVQDHIDILSLSAHKLYGPKGVGAVYLRQSQPRVRVTPFILGGGQERGLRSGTQNVPCIVGLGEACELARNDMDVESPRQMKLRDHMISRILSENEGVILNGHPLERLCNNVNVSVEAVLADQMLMALSEVAFSSGSACATGDDSHVISEIRKVQIHKSLIPGPRSDFTMRFGLGRMTRLEDINWVCDLIKATISKVRPVSKYL